MAHQASQTLTASAIAVQVGRRRYSLRATKSFPLDSMSERSVPIWAEEPVELAHGSKEHWLLDGDVGGGRNDGASSVTSDGLYRLA